MSEFVGRAQELKGLKELLKKRSSSLVVIRGRRRIGKSRLIEEYSKSFSSSYLFTGVPPVKDITAQRQRDEFVRQLHAQGVATLGTSDWGDLFLALAKQLPRGKILISLDEISWMGSKDPLFLSQLKTAWDMYFKKNPQLVLVLSGSHSTWIEKNILSSTGFLGRISYRLTLEELPLNECTKFWNTQARQCSPFEILKVLSVTGGVPRYLEEIRPDLSAEENIKRLCLRKEGLLFSEFDEIFSDLFLKKSPTYKKIVECLGEGKQTVKGVATCLGRASEGGDISSLLEDLCKCGFVTRDFTWDIKTLKESKLSHYRLSDNYLTFFLRLIEPNRRRIAAGSLKTLPTGWQSHLGLQFENLVCSPNNRDRLLQLLDIATDEVLFANPFFQNPSKRRKGCQIDLLIQTRFDILYVCEIKFSRRSIGKKIINEIQEKLDRIQTPRGVSKRPVLIHVNGVNDSVEDSGFFSNIVDFGQLLDSGVSAYDPG